MNTMLQERKRASQAYKLGLLIKPTLPIKENNLESNGLQRLITIGLNTTKNKPKNQVGRIFGDKMIIFMLISTFLYLYFMRTMFILRYFQPYGAD